MALDEAMDFNHIGPRLLAERRRRRLTQAQVAEEVGVSQPHISALETGRTLDWRTISKLEDFYDIPKHDLAARAFGLQTEVHQAIRKAVEIFSTDRDLLLSMYEFMRARGPLAGSGAG